MTIELAGCIGRRRARCRTVVLNCLRRQKLASPSIFEEACGRTFLDRVLARCATDLLLLARASFEIKKRIN
jgi:hypothetical protein